MLNIGNMPACLQMALDGALRMFEAQALGSMANILGLPKLETSYPVSFTLPIMPARDVAAFFDKYQLSRFSYLKVKVGAQTDDSVFGELGQLYTGPVWIDGNEAFGSVAELDHHVAYWQKHVLVAAIEQPFPANKKELMAETQGRYPLSIYADESLVHGADVGALARVGFGGINIKLQKAGTHAEAIHQRAEADRLGLRVMVGCMVETSLGIWHGLHHAHGGDCIDLDSMLYLTHEPMGFVQEQEGRLHPVLFSKLPNVGL
jgi:L-alanine-DL-glutamate epimerase-like enolase superfamily enzyme